VSKRKEGVPVWIKHKPKQTPEGVEKKAIKDYLKMQGWLVETNVQGPYTKDGRPDLEASRRGVTIRIEVKAPERRSINGILLPAGQLSPMQDSYIRELVRHGISVFVVWSKVEFVRELEIWEAKRWPGECSKSLFGG
jgi:hypothetical protein